LYKIVQCYERVQYIQYDDFDELKEIGSGGYRTVYNAKYSGVQDIPEIVVLRRFKNFDQMPELFVSEVSYFEIPSKMIFNLTLYIFYLIVQKSCQVHKQ